MTLPTEPTSSRKGRGRGGRQGCPAPAPPSISFLSAPSRVPGASVCCWLLHQILALGLLPLNGGGGVLKELLSQESEQ